jgi:glycosyltransferase involved in cell wall biosynthesis
LRILFVDQYSQWGGAQLMLRDLLTESRARGWHVEFMGPGDGDLLDFCEAQGIPAHHLTFGPYSSGRKSLRDVLLYGPEIARAARSVRSVVAACRIGLVFANGPRILPAVAGANCPVAFHLHSLLDKSYSRLLVRWALARNPSVVICCSKFVAKPIPGAHVIYNGVSDFRRMRARQKNAVPTVGIIGRIAPEKGHRDFLRAAALIHAGQREVRFTVHGSPLFSDPEFERSLRAMPEAGSAVFHGWAEDVAHVLQDLDILAVPSTGVDATPRIVMEALSAGTPVVAYPSGGIPELIRHGETGLLTSRSDYRALAQAIDSLLSDRGLMSRLARNGRAEWEARFRQDRFQREVCDLLERSAEQRGQTEPAAAVARKQNLG